MTQCESSGFTSPSRVKKGVAWSKWTIDALSSPLVPPAPPFEEELASVKLTAPHTLARFQMLAVSCGCDQSSS